MLADGVDVCKDGTGGGGISMETCTGVGFFLSRMIFLGGSGALSVIGRRS